MPRHIDVFAQLSLVSSQGANVLVHADKDIISLVFPNFQTARQVFKQTSNRETRKQVIAQFHQGLQLSDLTLQVKVSQQVVAQLTPQSQGGFFSRLVGVDPMELHMLAILRAAFSFA